MEPGALVRGLAIGMGLCVSDGGSLGMGRFDLTDDEWLVIAPLLPNKPRGVPCVDDRRVLNGIFYILGRDIYGKSRRVDFLLYHPQ